VGIVETWTASAPIKTVLHRVVINPLPPGLPNSPGGKLKAAQQAAPLARPVAGLCAGDARPARARRLHESATAQPAYMASRPTLCEAVCLAPSAGAGEAAMNVGSGVGSSGPGESQ
jgi:hypothetical protein